MYNIGVLQRRGLKKSLIQHPPIPGEIVYAVDTDEFGVLISGVLVWRKLFTSLDGLKFKDSVIVATTSNISLYGLPTIDDIVVKDGDRVLVKDQTNATQNGIYTASSRSWSRSSDADNKPTKDEVSGGMFCLVESGTTNGGTGWVLRSPKGNAVLGTDKLIFSKFSSSTLSAKEILTKLKTVDGSGSGLDADLLDGLDSSEFALRNGNSTQTFKVANAVKDNEAINKGQFNSLLPRTTTPIISIDPSINENEQDIITIINYDDKCSYNFSSNVGTITQKNAFIFTAMDITDKTNHSGTITCYATKAGEIRSNNTTTNIKIIYVPSVSDQTLSNANFKKNEEYNDGFTYKPKPVSICHSYRVEGDYYGGGQFTEVTPESVQ